MFPGFLIPLSIKNRESEFSFIQQKRMEKKYF